MGNIDYINFIIEVAKDMALSTSSQDVALFELCKGLIGLPVGALHQHSYIKGVSKTCVYKNGIIIGISPTYPIRRDESGDGKYLEHIDLRLEFSHGIEFFTITGGKNSVSEMSLIDIVKTIIKDGKLN